MNGVGSSCPFLMMRMTPFFCHTNMRPSGANAMPTSEYGRHVATVSVVNAGSVKSSADARCGCRTSRAATTTNTMNRLSYAMNLTAFSRLRILAPITLHWNVPVRGEGVGSGRPWSRTNAVAA